MVKHFNESEMTFIDGRAYCPECKNHNHNRFVPFVDTDCKNTYGKIKLPNGTITSKGQCECYSKEHKPKEHKTK